MHKKRVIHYEKRFDTGKCNQKHAAVRRPDDTGEPAAAVL